MANTDKFLDLSTGLPRLWSKIGDKFVAKEQGKGLVSIDTVLDSTSGASNTTVPSTKLMKDQLDTKIDKSSISASIATDTGSTTKVPSVAAVEGAITAAATPISQSITNDTGSTTKVPSVKAVEDAIDSALSTVYEYKGSVATEDLLPTTGVSTGDVYNIVAASSYGVAGMNVAAVVDGSTITWDNLGGSFTIQAISQAEVDAVCV